MTYHDPIDTAFAIAIVAFALLFVFCAAVAITKKIYEWGKRDGIEIGIRIGEANELRRRDDMNVRARARAAAELQVIREAIEREEWDKEIDVDKGVM